MDTEHSKRKNNRLQQERIARHWRQSDLAEHLGTSVITVRRWERGSQYPRAYFQVKLCALFGKSAEELGLLPESSETHGLDEVEEQVLSSNPEPVIWGLSYLRNPFFTGRQQILRILHDRLSREYCLALTRSWAISGLGGIGKTQIALEYAYQYRQDYTAVFWINAATQETLRTGLLSVAELLSLSEKDEHDQMLAVKTWLATHQGWLFIVDNADDIALVQDSVQNVLLAHPGGHVLLTSRAQALGSLAQQIQVETMGLVEAMLFLLRRAKLLTADIALEHASEEQLAAAEAIVIAMDCLPLALDQAGAYIEEVGCSLAAYLQLYQTHRAQLLQRRSHIPNDHPEPVATTWSLNFQLVEQANPAAAELLHLCAFLDPDMIPEEFFSQGRTQLSPLLQRVAADVFALNEAIEELRKFSLVQRDPETNVLRLHCLVQVVLQDAMDEEERLQRAQQVVRATALVFPETIEVTTLLCSRRFLPQAQVCSRLIHDYTLVFAEAATLLIRTARYLQDYGLYEQVELLYLQAMSIQEQIPGYEHPNVARSLNGLARLCREQSRYTEAEQFYQRALHIWEQSADPESLEMAHTLNGLAYLYGAQGKYALAEPLHKQALSLAEHAPRQESGWQSLLMPDEDAPRKP